MNKWIGITVLLFFASQTLLADKILSNRSVVYQKNGMYIAKLNAVIYGDYDRFVDRMMDVDHYIDMGVPYLVDIKVVSKNPKRWILWTHSYSFPIRAKHYSHVTLDRGKRHTKVTYKLLPMRGRYEVDHDYAHLSGHTKVTKINNKKNHYRVDCILRIKFQPGIFDLESIIKSKMLYQLEGTVYVFSR